MNRLIEILSNSRYLDESLLQTLKNLQQELPSVVSEDLLEGLFKYTCEDYLVDKKSNKEISSSIQNLLVEMFIEISEASVPLSEHLVFLFSEHIESHYSCVNSCSVVLKLLTHSEAFQQCARSNDLASIIVTALEKCSAQARSSVHHSRNSSDLTLTKPRIKDEILPTLHGHTVKSRALRRAALEKYEEMSNKSASFRSWDNSPKDASFEASIIVDDSPSSTLCNLAVHIGEACLAADLTALLAQKRDHELEKIAKMTAIPGKELPNQKKNKPKKIKRSQSFVSLEGAQQPKGKSVFYEQAFHTYKLRSTLLSLLYKLLTHYEPIELQYVRNPLNILFAHMMSSEFSKIQSAKLLESQESGEYSEDEVDIYEEEQVCTGEESDSLLNLINCPTISELSSDNPMGEMSLCMDHFEVREMPEHESLFKILKLYAQYAESVHFQATSNLNSESWVHGVKILEHHSKEKVRKSTDLILLRFQAALAWAQGASAYDYEGEVYGLLAQYLRKCRTRVSFFQAVDLLYENILYTKKRLLYLIESREQQSNHSFRHQFTHLLQVVGELCRQAPSTEAFKLLLDTFVANPAWNECCRAFAFSVMSDTVRPEARAVVKYFSRTTALLRRVVNDLQVDLPGKELAHTQKTWRDYVRKALRELVWLVLPEKGLIPRYLSKHNPEVINGNLCQSAPRNLFVTRSVLELLINLYWFSARFTPFKGPEYALFYIRMHYISFLKLYTLNKPREEQPSLNATVGNQWASDVPSSSSPYLRACLTLCKMHLKCLFAYARNRTPEVTRKFYQFRILEFLTREVSLEYDTSLRRKKFIQMHKAERARVTMKFGKNTQSSPNNQNKINATDEYFDKKNLDLHRKHDVLTEVNYDLHPEITQKHDFNLDKLPPIKKPDLSLKLNPEVRKKPDLSLNLQGLHKNENEAVSQKQNFSLNLPEIKKPDLSLKLPQSVSKNPDLSLKLPLVESKHPDLSLKLPSSVSKNPDLALNLPSSVSKNPDLSLKLPSSVTKKPDLSLNLPSSVSKNPDLSLKLPSSVSKNPDLSLKLPSSDIKHSDLSLKLPGNGLKRSDFAFNYENNENRRLDHGIELLASQEICKETDFYEQERRQREIYSDEELQVLIVGLIFCLVLTPTRGSLEEIYCSEFPIISGQPNSLFLLQHHINHPGNRRVLPALMKLIGHIVPPLAGQRLLKLLCSSFFDSSRYKGWTKIAAGTYGTVYECKTGLAEPDTVAVKKMEAPKSIYDRCVLHDIFNEIASLEEFRLEDCVTDLYDYGMDENDFYVVMKRYRCSLREWRLGLTGSLEENLPSILTMFKQVAKAVKVIHSRNTTHYDLKCDNVLLSEGFQVTIGDFGVCRMFVNSEDEVSMLNKGTDFIKSPEMLVLDIKAKKENEHYDRCKKIGTTRASDIWSLGCLFYELLTGEFLFYDDDWVQFYMRITQSNQELLSEENKAKMQHSVYLIDFLKYMLVRDPRHRPTIDNVLQRFEHLHALLVSAPRPARHQSMDFDLSFSDFEDIVDQCSTLMNHSSALRPFQDAPGFIRVTNDICLCSRGFLRDHGEWLLQLGVTHCVYEQADLSSLRYFTHLMLNGTALQGLAAVLDFIRAAQVHAGYVVFVENEDLLVRETLLAALSTILHTSIYETWTLVHSQALFMDMPIDSLVHLSVWTANQRKIQRYLARFPKYQCLCGCCTLVLQRHLADPKHQIVTECKCSKEFRNIETSECPSPGCAEFLETAKGMYGINWGHLTWGFADAEEFFVGPENRFEEQIILNSMNLELNAELVRETEKKGCRSEVWALYACKYCQIWLFAISADSRRVAYLQNICSTGKPDLNFVKGDTRVPVMTTVKLPLLMEQKGETMTKPTIKYTKSFVPAIKKDSLMLT